MNLSYFLGLWFSIALFVFFYSENMRIVSYTHEMKRFMGYFNTFYAKNYENTRIQVKLAVIYIRKIL